ncbi:FRIGIDA-like protein 4b [Humulus lupulus]|uniref:FRIGIDA-like protein 4b n=1 Tax=Humulus lupulus TaxID=3486 RepID=UPI002B402D56|nr:FRIGIDA-like protein 4b [Humulus lupulus]
MATELVVNTERVQKFFNDLEEQKTILSTCTQLFTTISTHFNSLQHSLSQKNQSLESRIQALESHSRDTLESLDNREASIPERESASIARIEEQRDAALAEFEKKFPENLELSQALKSFSRKMDSAGLVKFIVSRRKESVSLRAEIVQALAEAVDPPRLVLDSLEEFLNSKSAKAGVTDKRWACGLLVQALFPVNNSEKIGPQFAKSVVERAVKILEQWKGQVDGGESEGLALGAAEAVMFVQMVVGFRLNAKFDKAFLRKLMMEHASRRDMTKLAVALEDKEKMREIIDELVKNSKEIEAVYFACESGLTEIFSPVTLLKSHLRNSKKNVANILKNGNNSLVATEESSNVELNSIRAIIKCVEDHKLESEFSVDTLRKRATHLEKAKAERKKSSAASSKPQNKRGYSASSGRGGGGSSFRQSKAAKYSNTYSSFSRRNANPPPPVHHSPAARYSGAYNYPVPAVYDTPAPAPYHSPAARYSGAYNYPVPAVYDTPAPVPYPSSYGVPHAQSPVAIPQHYLSADNLSSTTFRSSGSYSGQTNYGPYDYANAAQQTYQPPSYPK